MVLVSCFSSAASELVHQAGCEGVSDAVALFCGGGAECDEQVGLAGAGVPDQAQRVTTADPVALGSTTDWLSLRMGYTASRLWSLFSAPPETHIAKIGNGGSQSRLTRQTDRHV